MKYARMETNQVRKMKPSGVDKQVCMYGKCAIYSSQQASNKQ